MRAFLLGLSVFVVVVSPHAAEAGLSTAPREMTASADTVPVTSQATVDRHRGGGHVHHARGIGGPIGAIGGAIGGLFRR